ncbi:sec14 cytosolic factor family protein [Schizosaccharomyces japonicus yFS275]|uniref:Sec14 cytosolic factor family protein n=1 Tax=Schizosaccharomyces japonicus (strain yFS275 / FY16936) TaxID=402676 RepID=B6K036_SCHJY|nr:sec14 cytosolic factor family protein [Schizosaccharomyces japonicus yFS275]EEB06186.1 sec14 cytosolic factor family protein [Schizosaccharomyces japonicus yFS275]
MFFPRIWLRCRGSRTLAATALAGSFFFRRKTTSESSHKNSSGHHDETGSDTVTSTTTKDGAAVSGNEEFRSPLKKMIEETWVSIRKIPEYREAFKQLTKADAPDAVLTRFLIACKEEPSAAARMLLNTLKWRLQEDVEDIVQKGELHAFNSGDEQFLKQLRTGKCTCMGNDLCGRPICHVRVRLHHPKELTQHSLEQLTLWIMETLRLLVRPVYTPAELCTERKVNVVFDLTNFGISNMDYTFVKFLATCLDNYYPESLGCCIVHHSPWVFRSIWRIIKGLLNPQIAKKIIFTQNVKQLSEYISMDVIPEDIGGKNPHPYHYVEPDEHENDLLAPTNEERLLALKRNDELFTKWEELALQWSKLPDNDTENDNVRSACDAAGIEFAKDYWKLDRYTRARTVYDRLGLIKAPKFENDSD